MDGRQCILTALDGGVPDPIPVAWGFRQADLTALAPYGTDVDGLVDIEFVAYPPTPADEDLREPPCPGATWRPLCGRLASWDDPDELCPRSRHGLH